MEKYLDPEKEQFPTEDLELEKHLRPQSFDDFAGQPQVVENLQVFVKAVDPRV